MSGPTPTGCTTVCNGGKDCTETSRRCADIPPFKRQFYPTPGLPDPPLTAAEAVAFFIIGPVLTVIGFSLLLSLLGWASTFFN